MSIFKSSVYDLFYCIYLPKMEQYEELEIHVNKRPIRDDPLVAGCGAYVLLLNTRRTGFLFTHNFNFNAEGAPKNTSVEWVWVGEKAFLCLLFNSCLDS